jgi:hypothetical protein
MQVVRYGLYGTDGMMHLVEEMRDASKQAPVCYTTFGTKASPCMKTNHSSACHGLVNDFLQYN